MSPNCCSNPLYSFHQQPYINMPAAVQPTNENISRIGVLRGSSPTDLSPANLRVLAGSATPRMRACAARVRAGAHLISTSTCRTTSGSTMITTVNTDTSCYLVMRMRDTAVRTPTRNCTRVKSSCRLQGDRAAVVMPSYRPNRSLPVPSKTVSLPSPHRTSNLTGSTSATLLNRVHVDQAARSNRDLTAHLPVPVFLDNLLLPVPRQFCDSAKTELSVTLRKSTSCYFPARKLTKRILNRVKRTLIGNSDKKKVEK